MLQGDDNLIEEGDIRNFTPELPINFNDRTLWSGLTKDANDHISHDVFGVHKQQFKGNVSELCDFYTRVCQVNQFMQQVIDHTGWHHVCKVKLKKNDVQLVSALIERWWDTTHTFHLPSVEVGFTPLDFTVITGIPVGRGNQIPWNPIESKDEREQRWYEVFLDRNFEEFCLNDRGITCSMLKILLTDPIPVRRRNGPLTPREIELLRAFFLLAIGEIWFPNNRKIVYMEWLEAVEDVHAIGTLDWGTSIMAMMYKDLDNASRMRGQTVECCWFLLQYWFYEHVGASAPILAHPEEDFYSRILRWAPERHQKKRKGVAAGLVAHDKEAYRLALENVQPNSFYCNPFAHSPLCEESEDVQAAFALSKRRTIFDGADTVQFYLGERLHFQLTAYFCIPCPPPDPMFIKRHEFEHWTENEAYPVEGDNLRTIVDVHEWLAYWTDARSKPYMLPGVYKAANQRYVNPVALGFRSALPTQFPDSSAPQGPVHSQREVEDLTKYFSQTTFEFPGQEPVTLTPVQRTDLPHTSYAPAWEGMARHESGVFQAYYTHAQMVYHQQEAVMAQREAEIAHLRRCRARERRRSEYYRNHPGASTTDVFDDSLSPTFGAPRQSSQLIPHGEEGQSSEQQHNYDLGDY